MDLAEFFFDDLKFHEESMRFKWESKPMMFIIYDFEDSIYRNYLYSFRLGPPVIA